MVPWRLPSGVEVQAIVRDTSAHVRGSLIKGRRRQPRASGQHNRFQVTVNLEHAMLVIVVAAPGRLRASVPVQSAFSAGHGTADLDHGTTIAANCPDDPLESITLTPFQWNPHALRAAGTGGLGVGIPRGRSQIDRLRSGGLVAAVGDTARSGELPA